MESIESLFTPVMVSDQMITDIEPKVQYPVRTGAAQSTWQNFSNLSATSAQIQCNIQLPSISAVMNRRLPIATTIGLQINIDKGQLNANTNAALAANTTVFNYGVTDVIQSWVLNRLISSASVTFNGASVNCQTPYVMDHVLATCNAEKLQYYNGGTSCFLDNSYNYSDLVATTNSIFNGFKSSSYNDALLPRGCFKIQTLVVEHSVNGSYVDDSVISSSTPTLDSWKIFLQVYVEEPVLGVSPLSFEENGSEGLVGLSQINYTLTVDSSCRNVFSSSTGWISSIALGGTLRNGTTVILPFTDTKFLANFKTVSPQDAYVLAKKQVFPYLRIMNYPTSNLSAAGGTVGVATVSTQQSATFSFGEIPSYLSISVRLNSGVKNWNKSITQLPIRKINILFNNKDNLLNSMNQNQLWSMSRDNGLQMSFQQFSGQLQETQNVAGGVPITAPTLTNTTNQIIGIGSILYIDCAKDLQLGYGLAPACGGTYNFSCQIDVENYTGAAISVEIVINAYYKNLFISEQGTSRTQGALLTPAIVSDVLTKQAGNDLTSNEVKEMVGGGPMGNYNKLARIMKNKAMGGSLGGVLVGGAALDRPKTLRNQW